MGLDVLEDALDVLRVRRRGEVVEDSLVVRVGVHGEEHGRYEVLGGFTIALGSLELGEVVAKVRLGDLGLEQIELVQEEDARGVDEPRVGVDGLKQRQALPHPILVLVFKENLLRQTDRPRGRERKREIKKKRERVEGEREGVRERAKRKRERGGESERGGEREREREGEREKERERKTERERQRERERQSERQRKRQTERERERESTI